MMTDHATSTHYFDCPGFEDTRGSCVEVSTTYYMKDITRHARSVKALLLAPYYALKQGQDREDFLKMLRHASRLLRADAKLSDSVGLVVTKVDAFKKQKANGKKVKVPTDEAVVKTVIAKFLAEHVARHLETQMNGAADAEQREEFRRMAAVVAAVLRQDSAGNYTRIGIFRTPDSEGPIKSVKLVEDGRQGLLDLVHRTLRYAAVQPADFGFSVSDRTKLFALTQADKLSRAVVGKLTSLGASIAESRARRVYDHGDIPSTADSLLAEAGKLRRLAGDLKTSASVQAFCDRLTRDVQGGPEGAQAAEVAADARYLDVLQVVSDKPLVDGGVLASQWALPFDEAADLLAAREHWNRFLIALYDRLNEYDGQRYLRDSAILPVSEANLTSFERVSSKLGLSTKLHAPASNVSDLNALLTRMGRKPKFVCENAGRLVVYSESIILTQVAAAAHTHCTGGVQAVEVYALNTVFVDADVVLPGVSLAVLAPRWEVRGDSRIILNGLNGDPPAPRPREARDGARGADGVPGKPGKPGGNFLAVGLEVVGKGRVFLHGGDGGKGQDGAHGGPGRAGGGDGGDGGNGGKGGVGGNPGRGLVVDLGGPDSLADIAVEARFGAEGPPGRGGRGGDRRPHSGPPLRYRRRKRFVITGLVLGGLALAGIGAGVYYGSRTTEPPPRYYVPQYSDGRRGADGQSGASRSWLWLRLPTTADCWSGVSSRMETYFQHNADHPYLKAGLREFLRLAAADPAFTQLAPPKHGWVF